MAVIHQGRNQPREELDAYIAECVERDRRWHEDALRKRPRRVCVAVILLVLCVAAILLLIFAPVLLDTAQETVQSALMNWSDQLMTFQSSGGDEVYEKPFMERITQGLLDVLWWLVKAAFGVVVFAVGWLSPILTAAVFFGIPAAIGAQQIWVLFDRVGTYDPERSAEWARNNLPSQQKALLAGIEGEERALRLLDRLDNDCHVFTNLRVPYQDGVSETDVVVVSPAGITVVEVKNHKNTVMGDLSDEQLIYRHVSRRGKKKDSTFYNPVKQVGTHVYRLANFLRERGFDVHVRRCVLFMNESVTLRLTDRSGIGGECPVFLSNSPGFFRYLTGGEQRDTLGNDTVREIAFTLDRLLWGKE